MEIAQPPPVLDAAAALASSLDKDATTATRTASLPCIATVSHSYSSQYLSRRSPPYFTPRVHRCSRTDPSTPSTFTPPFPFTPGVQRSVMKHGSRRGENNITKMPHHVTPTPRHIPFTLHINLFPGAEWICFMGFSQTTYVGKGGPHKTEDFGPPIFRIVFVLFFFYGGGENRLRLILQSQSHTITFYLVPLYADVVDTLCSCASSVLSATYACLSCC